MHAHGAERRSRQAGASIARQRAEHVRPAAHIVQFVEDQIILRLRSCSPALALGRFEKDGELALAFQIGVEIGGEQRTGAVGFAADRPIRAQPQKNLIPERLDPRIGRFVDAHPFVAAPNEQSQSVKNVRPRSMNS